MSKLDRHWRRQWLVACNMLSHGPLARYGKIVGCACTGNAGNVFPTTTWCVPGSLTSWWQGIRSRHSLGMRNPQFYVFGKRPTIWTTTIESWEHIGIKKQQFSWKMHLKMSPAKWQPFYLGLNVSAQNEYMLRTHPGACMVRLRSLNYLVEIFLRKLNEEHVHST